MESKLWFRNYACSNYGEFLEELSKIIKYRTDNDLKLIAAMVFNRYFHSHPEQKSWFDLESNQRSRIRQNFISILPMYSPSNYLSELLHRIANIELLHESSELIDDLINIAQAQNVSINLKHSCIELLLRILQKILSNNSKIYEAKFQQILSILLSTRPSITLCKMVADLLKSSDCLNIKFSSEEEKYFVKKIVDNHANVPDLFFLALDIIYRHTDKFYVYFENNIQDFIEFTLQAIRHQKYYFYVMQIWIKICEFEREDVIGNKFYAKFAFQYIWPALLERFCKNHYHMSEFDARCLEYFSVCAVETYSSLVISFIEDNFNSPDFGKMKMALFLIDYILNNPDDEVFFTNILKFFPTLISFRHDKNQNVRKHTRFILQKLESCPRFLSLFHESHYDFDENVKESLNIFVEMIKTNEL